MNRQRYQGRIVETMDCYDRSNAIDKTATNKRKPPGEYTRSMCKPVNQPRGYEIEE